MRQCVPSGLAWASFYSPSLYGLRTTDSSMKNLLKKTDSKSSDSDPNRNALFGGRAKTSPPPQDSRSRLNPYAPPRNASYQDSNPYASNNDPYASRGYDQNPRRPSPAPRGYSNESQDSARAALFGNRPPPTQDPYVRGYDPEPDRYDEYQQQAEGDEDEVEAIKQEIRFTKQESLSSTRNAIRIASEAEEQGRNTLVRLGAQSEKIAGVEKNLDVSAAHTRAAEDKAKELKKLNRSMFAVHVSNPFNSKTRAEEEERKIMERHDMERDEREKNRKYAYESAQRVNGALNKPGSGRIGGVKEVQRSTINARSPYSFEEDEEDVQIEKDIDANLQTLGDITGRLKGLALATQTEIEAQNKKLDQIANKVFCSSCEVNDRVIILNLGFTSTRSVWTRFVRKVEQLCI